MPKKIAKKQPLAVRSRMSNDDFDDDDAESGEGDVASISQSVTQNLKKRQLPEDMDPGTKNFGNEMQKMLECFGADISKTLSAKRKRLEGYTQSSMKSSNRRVDDIWNQQQNERYKLNQEYHKQSTAVFQQWESDLEKTKDHEENLQNLFRSQQKLFQQTRIVQSQRLKTLKQLTEQYMKGMNDLEKCHLNQQGNVQAELKKEMALLQKKILMDTQQQEMANVRKSLQTMLFQ